MKVFINIDTEQTMAGQAAPNFQTAHALRQLAEAFEAYDCDTDATGNQMMTDSDNQVIGIFTITNETTEIKFTNLGKGKPRTVLLNGKAVGGVIRREAGESFDAHWQGSIQANNNEVWTITELTLKDVENRVKEAFGL